GRHALATPRGWKRGVRPSAQTYAPQCAKASRFFLCELIRFGSVSDGWTVAHTSETDRSQWTGNAGVIQRNAAPCAAVGAHEPMPVDGLNVYELIFRRAVPLGGVHYENAVLHPPFPARRSGIRIGADWCVLVAELDKTEGSVPLEDDLRDRLRGVAG